MTGKDFFASVCGVLLSFAVAIFIAVVIVGATGLWVVFVSLVAAIGFVWFLWWRAGRPWTL